MNNCIGKLLIANPTNPEDDLARSVLFCTTHTKNIAIGLQINKLNDRIDLSTVAYHLGIEYYGSEPVWCSGNISTDKIHVIHSLDWKGVSTVPLGESIGVTSDIGILAAISKGKGPRLFKACSGYWLFDNGRLDKHLSKEKDPSDPFKWEVIEADLGLVFLSDYQFLWEECLQNVIVKKVKQYF